MKILLATCVGGVVSIQQNPIFDPLLGQLVPDVGLPIGAFYPALDVIKHCTGLAPSIGVVIIDGYTARYITSNVLDNTFMLAQISAQLAVLIKALGDPKQIVGVAGSATAVLGVPPHFATAVTELTSINSLVTGWVQT